MIHNFVTNKVDLHYFLLRSESQRVSPLIIQDSMHATSLCLYIQFLDINRMFLQKSELISLTSQTTTEPFLPCPTPSPHDLISDFTFQFREWNLGFPAPMSFFLCGKLTAMYPKGSLMDWIRRRRQHGRRDGLWLERQPPLRPHMATIISLQSAEFSGLNRGQSGTSSVRIHIHVWFHNRVCVWLLFTTSKLPLTSSDNICEQWLGCPPGLAKGPNLWDCLRLPSPSHRCAFREGKLAR